MIQACERKARNRYRGRHRRNRMGILAVAVLIAMDVAVRWDSSRMEEKWIREVPSPGASAVTERVEQYTSVLEPEEIRCWDAAAPVGQETVLREGSPGEMLYKARVTYVDGKEASRLILEERVHIQPVSRVVAVGCAEPVKPTEPVLEIGNGLIRLPTGEVLTYDRVMTSLATAYCDKGLTATGTQARVGAIAVDPEVIPYGTRMFIVSKDGEYIYGIATAEDCGSKDHIYDTRIDLHFDTYRECRDFGARYCRVYFLS